MELTRPADRRSLESFLFDELAATTPLRGEPALDHARRFAALLGDPQDEARQVHVVGTAGKGAAAGAITRIAVDASVPVVTHMSPHVYDLRERFLVDGELPDWDLVLDAASDVHSAAVTLAEQTARPPSFFAATAALAWVLGRRRAAALLVTEAGIGGRWDATNVIGRADKVTVVTAIGIDHRDVLGDDLTSIAGEKAAAITPGGVVVVGPQSHQVVRDVVVAVAAEKGARIRMVDQSIRDWRRAAFETASRVGLELGLVVESALSHAALPGRLELMELGGHAVVLDGAHNPMKLDALFSTLASDPSTSGRPLTGLVAVGRSKDLEACADVLAAGVGRAVVTEFGDPEDPAAHPRSWPAREVSNALVARGVEVLGEMTEPGVAAELALASLRTRDVLVVTGSFLHLAEVRDRLAHRPDVSRRRDDAS